MEGLSFIYLETDKYPCNDGWTLFRKPSTNNKSTSTGVSADIIGVGFTYKNCDPEYEGILVEYRYLLLLHAFQQSALTQILYEPSQGA
jgi:hypothetical protein